MKKMNKYKFFVYCPEEGFEVFETLDEAVNCANHRVQSYLGDDGWSEDVTDVLVGNITHRSAMCDQVFPDGEIDEDGLDEAGEYWESDKDYKCNYKMLATAPQPTEQQIALNKLNADREQTMEVEAAPSHGLPNWSECNLRVGNSEWLKDNGRKPECDSLIANPLHEFIYEYDDSDTYKSAWFLHRLEKLIDFIRSEQVPAPDVSALVEALECMIIGAGAVAVPHNGERAVLQEAVNIATAALATHRKKGGA